MAIRSTHLFTSSFPVSHTGIQCGDEGACTIARHLAKTHVEKLDVSGQGMTKVGLSALASVLTASTLRELDISENEVESTGIVELCRALAGNTTLQVLTATGLFCGNTFFVCMLYTVFWTECNMGDDGAVALAHLLFTNHTIKTYNIQCLQLEFHQNTKSLIVTLQQGTGLQPWACLHWQRASRPTTHWSICTCMPTQPETEEDWPWLLHSKSTTVSPSSPSRRTNSADRLSLHLGTCSRRTQPSRVFHSCVCFQQQKRVLQV